MNAMRRARQMNINRDAQIDYGIILSVIILAIIGITSVYATTVMIEGKDLIPTLFHALWYALGAITIIVVMQFDSEQYWKLANYIYGFGLLLLVLVLLFHDRQLAIETGGKSWFTFGSFSFQPSEVFKPAYIVFLAKVITQHNNKFTHRTLKTDFQLLVKIVMVMVPAVLLIQLQHDLGTNLVILAITAGMIVMSGISWRILLPIIITAVVLGGGIILVMTFFPDWLIEHDIIYQYQIDRVNNWLDPFSDTRQSGYQLAQSIKAIASGGLSGKGFGVSEVTVPVRESDFIFTTIGENTGFLGSSFLLFIYFLLIYQMVQTCFETKNQFYTYICAGVISMILFHVLENVGMTIGLLPITGIPLPFVSQGGSALLGNMIGVGLVLSMKYHSRSYMFASNDI